MQATGPLSRRDFLARVAFGTSAVAIAGLAKSPSLAADIPAPPIALFSKICQEVDLDFGQTADLTERSGLEGIDCPVRPGGQVLPERVADDLPRLADALKKRQRRLLLLTTAIKGADSPNAESILRTARDLGVKYYRLGYWNYRPGTPPETVLREAKAQLKDLAAMNKELGMCAVHQNHAGTNLVGAKVRDLYEIASAFSPEEVGIAFDIGHALHELPETWRAEFERLRSHFRVAYVKDWKTGTGFVPLGQGEIAQTDFFKRFKAVQCGAPISLHVEYTWDLRPGEKKSEGLIRALRRDADVLRKWWAAA